MRKLDKWPDNNEQKIRNTYIVVNPSEGGHAATCSRCGWKSRGFQVPDTAYTEGKKHYCKDLM